MNVEPIIERFGRTDTQPIATVVVLNRNGAGWLPKCFESIKNQTIASQLETVLVDNDSSDDSVAVGRALLKDFPSAAIVRNPIGLGYCGGNNSGTKAVRGKYAMYINNDAWMEPDCMEKLIAEMPRAGAAAASPWVLNYADNTHQDLGFFGFDIFGLPSASKPTDHLREIFISGGCSYFIEVEVFKQVGMFDAEFFMYSDEVDLSWRVWIAGHKIVGIPNARVHHRGAAGVNPAGGQHQAEFRTDDEKRFLTIRNCFLTLLKNGRHVLLLLLIPQFLLITLETAVGCILLRRWSFAKNTLWAAIKDCWRLRHHVLAERRRIAAFRQHGDFWMLRFLRLEPNRWFEIKRMFRYGLPRVNRKT